MVLSSDTLEFLHSVLNGQLSFKMFCNGYENLLKETKDILNIGKKRNLYALICFFIFMQRLKNIKLVCCLAKIFKIPHM